MKRFKLIITTLIIVIMLFPAVSARAAEESAEITETGNSTVYVTGSWIHVSDGRWWYMHTDNSYTKNDWEKIQDRWYFFDEKGWMKTGWINYKNQWYYLNDTGAMETGWVKYKNQWYYLNENGDMKTGWVKYKNQWYYLNDNGDMAENKWVNYQNKWYYVNQQGTMLTGWIHLKERYYADESGAIYTNTSLCIDGKTYSFNKDGVATYAPSKEEISEADGLLNKLKNCKEEDIQKIELIQTPSSYANGKLILSKSQITEFVSGISKISCTLIDAIPAISGQENRYLIYLNNGDTIDVSYMQYSSTNAYYEINGICYDGSVIAKFSW